MLKNNFIRLLKALHIDKPTGINVGVLLGIQGVLLGWISLYAADPILKLILSVLLTIFAIPLGWFLLWLFIRDKPPNPYTTGAAVTPPNFVGRYGELARLQDALDKTESIAFIGTRRIGKSSLLRTWEQQLQAQGRTVAYVSGQGVDEKPDKDKQIKIVNLVQFIQAVCGSDNPKNKDPDHAANSLKTWAKNQALPPVILLDEAESLIKSFPARFWIRMRACSQAGELSFIFASYQPLNEVYQASHEGDSPFNNIVIHVHVGLLEEAAVEQLIRRGGFKKQQGKDIRTWAGRHPFLLQIYAEELYYAREHGKSEQHALDEAEERAQLPLSWLWQQCQPQERAVLMQLANEEDSDGLASLRLKGLIDDENQLFAQVWQQWLKKQH